MIRRTLASAVLLAVLFTLAGCDLWVPQSTLTNGETSDGVSGQVGQIYVANAVLVAHDGRANLVVSLVNESNKEVPLRIAYGDRETTDTVKVPARSVTQVGTPGNQYVTLEHLQAKPGSLYDVFFQYGSETGVQLGVPVLTNAQPQYRHLGPTSTPGR
jgi:hypothetical protein